MLVNFYDVTPSSSKHEIQSFWVFQVGEPVNQFRRAYCTFSSVVMSLTRCGAHMDCAYSKCGRTNDVEIVLNFHNLRRKNYVR